MLGRPASLPDGVPKLLVLPSIFVNRKVTVPEGMLGMAAKCIDGPNVLPIKTRAAQSAAQKLNKCVTFKIKARDGDTVPTVGRVSL